MVSDTTPYQAGARKLLGVSGPSNESPCICITYIAGAEVQAFVLGLPGLCIPFPALVPPQPHSPPQRVHCCLVISCPPVVACPLPPTQCQRTLLGRCHKCALQNVYGTQDSAPALGEYRNGLQVSVNSVGLTSEQECRG